MTYTTTPELLKTIAAVATATSTADATMATVSRTGAPVTTFTGAASELAPSVGAALAGAMGIVAFFV